MAKDKAKGALAVTKAAGLAARQIAAMERNAKDVDANETERRDVRLQLLSAPTGMQAVIKNDRFMVRIDGDTFAVTSRD